MKRCVGRDLNLRGAWSQLGGTWKFWFPQCGSCPKRTEKLSSWVFMGASVHSQNWLSPWPLSDSTSSFSSLPGGWGVALKVPTLWSSGWSSRQLAPDLGRVQNSPSLITGQPFQLYGSKAFSGTMDKDQIYLRNIYLVIQSRSIRWIYIYYVYIKSVFLINHCITDCFCSSSTPTTTKK